jgi:hypothetical protein
LVMAGLLWEKNTAGWWLISQANRVVFSPITLTEIYIEILNPWWVASPFPVFSTRPNFNVTITLFY